MKVNLRLCLFVSMSTTGRLLFPILLTHGTLSILSSLSITFSLSIQIFYQYDFKPLIKKEATFVLLDKIDIGHPGLLTFHVRSRVNLVDFEISATDICPNFVPTYSVTGLQERPTLAIASTRLLSAEEV